MRDETKHRRAPAILLPDRACGHLRPVACISQRFIHRRRNPREDIAELAHAHIGCTQLDELLTKLLRKYPLLRCTRAARARLIRLRVVTYVLQKSFDYCFHILTLVFCNFSA